MEVAGIVVFKYSFFPDYFKLQKIFWRILKFFLELMYWNYLDNMNDFDR